MFRRAAFALPLMLALAGAASAGDLLATTAPDGGTLVLENGERLRLAGIEPALPPPGSPPERRWPLAQAAQRRLAALAVGAPLALADLAPAPDRDGRRAAHVLAGGAWVQGMLLAEGLARVRTLPHDRARAAAMLAMEREARAEGRGMWATRAYAVRDAANAEDLRRDAGSFQIVAGRALRAERRADAVYIDFGADWRTDTTARLDREAQRRCAAAGLDPLTLAGTALRLRGWIDDRHGPQIVITHPEQIERAAEP
jgi:micrococcal nuclease